MTKPIIYLDHAATTPVCPAAAQAAVEAMTEGFGNPSSQYPLGKEAAKRREEHRSTIAAALGCAPEELFFTSCGTEGDNWAIRAAVELGRKKGNHIVTTAIEHDAVLQPMKALRPRASRSPSCAPTPTETSTPRPLRTPSAPTPSWYP